jgi:hypothetical protein
VIGQIAALKDVLHLLKLLEVEVPDGHARSEACAESS